MTYNPKNEMFAKIILASEHPNGKPIYSVHMRYPRPIHGEVMTHREFSRNARSSRAVPIKTMLEEVRTKPYIPWHWGANQKGMQAGAECNEPVLIPDWDDVNFHGNPHLRSHDRVEAWLHARDQAVNVAEAFMKAGYHKQIVNRLLEPFSWIDTLVTTTSFSNFLWLRQHKDAEPHLQDLAHMVAEAIHNATPTSLNPGEWHLPYITGTDRQTLLIESGRLAGDRYTKISGVNDHNEWLRRISAARCARISYTPFDGDPSYERELERYNMLVTSERVHASPLEHQATPDVYNTGQELCQFPSEPGWEHTHLHGNLTGWIQARKLVPGEYHA